MPIVPPPVLVRGTTYTHAIAATVRRRTDAWGRSARPRCALDVGVGEINLPS
jgi:hypothetical protein